MTPIRICTLCKQPFPATLEYFFKQPNGKYGLSSRCKRCHTSRTTKHQSANRQRYNRYQAIHREKHKETITARQRQWCVDHPEAVQKAAARYRNKHREKVRFSQRISKQRQRRANPEASRAYDREYRQRPNARLTDKVNGHAKRARKRQAEGSHTPAQELQQLKRQHGRCYYCKTKLTDNWQADHVIPLSRGGSNDISNIVIACPTCNNRKLDKLPHEWTEGGRLL